MQILGPDVDESWVFVHVLENEKSKYEVQNKIIIKDQNFSLGKDQG
jgi:hypothetical protein